MYCSNFGAHFESKYFSLQKELASIITLEQGKTLADAEGDVHRGLRKINLKLFLTNECVSKQNG